jgi:DNA-binding Lrp family transcriptional regulator
VTAKEKPLLYRGREGKLVSLDATDTKILKAILEDGGASDDFLSKELGIGMPEIKQRRKKLERNAVVNRSYKLDVFAFGWRAGDININVEKGNSEKVAKKVFRVNANIEEITLRIDSTSNVTARIYYRDSEELNSIMESIRAMSFVKGAHFSEIIKVIRMRSVGKMSGVFDSRILKPDARGGGPHTVMDWAGFEA